MDEMTDENQTRRLPKIGVALPMGALVVCAALIIDLAVIGGNYEHADVAGFLRDFGLLCAIVGLISIITNRRS